MLVFVVLPHVLHHFTTEVALRVVIHVNSPEQRV